MLPRFCLAVLAAATLHGQITCAPCHKQIAESYGRTGMARSFALASNVPAGTYRHEASEEAFSVFQRAGKAWLRREQTGFDGKPANVIEKAIEYQFGSGNHAVSYFARDAQGGLIELPLSWYSEGGGHWGMSPGYEGAQHAGFTRKVNDRCFFCHTSEKRTEAHGIGCDRCHGPATTHAGKILNPAKLTHDRERDVCLQCHLETTNLTLPGMLPVYGREVFSYRPGEPLTEYALFFDHAPKRGFDDKFEFSSAPYRLFQSACFKQSNDAITCTTCHDPHKPAEDHARTLTACRTCHADLKEHHAGEDCVTCHMADRRPSDAVHVFIKDHRIQRVLETSAEPVAEKNSATLALYRGPVVPYYPERAITEQQRLYLAVAQVKNQANLKQGIPALEKAIASVRPASPDFELDLADAYRRDGQAAKAVAAYRDVIARDPKRWQAWQGLGLSLARTGAVVDAETALKRALELSPSEPSVYESLSSVQLQKRDAPTAISTLREGLKRIPDSPELANSLGTALLNAGNTEGAEPALREAVRLRPEVAAIRLNLASLIARRNSFTEARFEFLAALRLDPTSAGAHSAFGTALAAHGDKSDAKTEFEMALRLSPGLANTHNNLGIVLGDLGDREGSIREFRAAIVINPQFATAHFNLARALENRGQREAAEAEARLALQYNPGYREASDLLRRMAAQAPKP